MAGNSKHFIYDMADFESARGHTSKFSNFLCRDAFLGQRRPYSNDCGSVQKFKARLVNRVFAKYLRLSTLLTTQRGRGSKSCLLSLCMPLSR